MFAAAAAIRAYGNQYRQPCLYQLFTLISSFDIDIVGNPFWRKPESAKRTIIALSAANGLLEV
jgi:hypothetical protein